MVSTVEHIRSLKNEHNLSHDQVNDLLKRAGSAICDILEESLDEWYQEVASDEQLAKGKGSKLIAMIIIQETAPLLIKSGRLSKDKKEIYEKMYVALNIIDDYKKKLSRVKGSYLNNSGFMESLNNLGQFCQGLGLMKKLEGR